MKVLVVADDLGYSKSFDEGIEELFACGIVKSSSLLMNGASTESAVEMALKDNINMGLHMNITEGEPISDKSQIESLLDSEGIFLGKIGFRRKWNEGMICEKHVITELRAQIERFIDLVGETPIFANGHQHFHTVDTKMTTLIARIFNEYSIKWTRVACDQMIEEFSFPSELKGLGEFHKEVSIQSANSFPTLNKAGIKSSDSFLGLCLMGSLCSESAIIKQLETVSKSHSSDSTLEVMVHVGHRVLPKERAGCSHYGADSFFLGSEREHELNQWKSKRVSELDNTDFIGYNNL